MFSFDYFPGESTKIAFAVIELSSANLQFKNSFNHKLSIFGELETLYYQSGKSCVIILQINEWTLRHLNSYHKLLNTHFVTKITNSRSLSAPLYNSTNSFVIVKKITWNYCMRFFYIYTYMNMHANWHVLKRFSTNPYVSIQLKL